MTPFKYPFTNILPFRISPGRKPLCFVAKRLRAFLCNYHITIISCCNFWYLLKGFSSLNPFNLYYTHFYTIIIAPSGYIPGYILKSHNFVTFRKKKDRPFRKFLPKRPVRGPVEGSIPPDHPCGTAGLSVSAFSAFVGVVVDPSFDTPFASTLNPNSLPGFS